MFPLNSNDQYIDPNGKRHTLGELFERSEHDIEELEETVSGHTTKIGLLETLTGAIQDQISTDEYSAESDYAEGDYVIHDNKLYKCNTTCTADTWTNNSTYFTETSVADEFTALNSDLSNKQDKLTNPLTKSDVVNNLTTTTTNVPLSAAQGKVLNDNLGDKQNKTDNSLQTTSKTIVGGINELKNRWEIKRILCGDTNPINITGKTDGVVTVQNFISALPSSNYNAVIVPFIHASGNLYAYVKDASTMQNTTDTSSIEIRVNYLV